MNLVERWRIRGGQHLLPINKENKEEKTKDKKNKGLIKMMRNNLQTLLRKDMNNLRIALEITQNNKR